MPVLTQGAVTWTWTKADIGRLMAADEAFKEYRRKTEKNRN
jgi:hypothetical protein